MKTDCTTRGTLFPDIAGRQAVARFDAGAVTSDAGVLLLERTDRRLDLLRRFAGCFRDHRDARRIEHAVEQMVRQRVFGLCLGYEDITDHDHVGKDPLFAATCGKRAGALASHPTLSRLECTPRGATSQTRYAKIEMLQERVDDLLVDAFTEAKGRQYTGLIVIDVDHSDVPLHGEQEGRFFHGYYGHYCYLPLYVFSGEHLLAAHLQTADGDATRDVVDVVERIVARLRATWPGARILLRGDSGFAREKLMTWCEDNGHFYVLGLARNSRLQAHIEDALLLAAQKHEKSGRAERVFCDFEWSTRETWSRERRVVAKAEHLPGGKSNPRFIVSNLSRRSWRAQRLYEELYCARGEAENRTKEKQLDLFGGRLSTQTMQGNRVRMAMSAMAYVLTCALRRIGLYGTKMARAQAATIRMRLLKIGATVRLTTRRIWVSMSALWPWKDLFETCAARLLAPG